MRPDIEQSCVPQRFLANYLGQINRELGSAEQGKPLITNWENRPLSFG